MVTFIKKYIRQPLFSKSLVPQSKGYSFFKKKIINLEFILSLNVHNARFRKTEKRKRKGRIQKEKKKKDPSIFFKMESHLTCGIHLL